MLWILFIILAIIIYYLWISLPIISGFAAKQMATWVFVSKRKQEDVQRTDLGWFPINLAKNKIDFDKKTVTATVFGVAEKKVVFREKLGATLINEITEEELNNQPFNIQISQPKTSDLPWPEGNNPSDDIPPEVNQERLQSAIEKAFTEPDKNKKRRTRAVVVIYDGKLIAEKYAPGFSEDMPMYGWSMAKSMTAALVGILVRQGKLKVGDPAPVPEWQSEDDPRHSITIEDLLHQMSGLRFTEVYTRASGVTNMLYKNDDMGRFAAQSKLKHRPNTHFYYSSGNSNILSRLIRQVVPADEYATFPYKELFYKIGMESAVFEPDASGTFVGSSYIHATARDYARFGLLYMNDGVWNGERILPKGWVKATATAPESNELRHYGYQFWLNGFKDAVRKERVFPDAPEDLFYMHGYGEQSVFIIPSRKVIVVRLGFTIDESFDENEFVRDILGCID